MNRDMGIAMLAASMFAAGCGGEANAPGDPRESKTGGAVEPTDTGPADAPEPGASDAETPKPTGQDPAEDPAETTPADRP